jgi:hypothetical protein
MDFGGAEGTGGGIARSLDLHTPLYPNYNRPTKRRKEKMGKMGQRTIFPYVCLLRGKVSQLGCRLRRR